jgi:hypothetical protein
MSDMKNLNTPLAIIISSIIISISIFLTSSKDPLSNCMEKVMTTGQEAMVAAHLCSGKTK